MKKLQALLTLLNGKSAGWKMLNAIALTVAVMSVNSACLWFHHQPEVPAELKRFRKF